MGVVKTHCDKFSNRPLPSADYAFDHQISAYVESEMLFDFEP